MAKNLNECFVVQPAYRIPETDTTLSPCPNDMSLIAASTTQSLHRAAELEIKDLKQWRNTYNQNPYDDHWELLDEGDVNQTDGR